MTMLTKMTSFDPRVRSLVYLTVPFMLSVLGLWLQESSSFWARQDNHLNLYLVKFGWGWTLGLISAAMLVVHLVMEKLEPKTIALCIFRLIVATLVWYCFTASFRWVEELTGSCHVIREVENGVELTRRQCLKGGHRWIGFDISGHCFLMTWNNLFIAEEVLKLRRFSSVQLALENGQKNKSFLELCLFVLIQSLAILMSVWDVMLFFTSLYFHTVTEKVLGSVIAVIAWYSLYQNVYVRMEHFV